MAQLGCLAAGTLLGAGLGFVVSERRRARQRKSKLRLPVRSSEQLLEGESTELEHLASSGHVAARHIYGLGRFCTYNRVLLCMVGLPARGKSYIVNMLTRYLRWTGFPVKSFNAGSLRRTQGMAGVEANFFGSGNEAVREELASRCMDEAISWLADQVDVAVAIFDATNTTVRRRDCIAETCRKFTGITPVFVESICDDPEVLESNYRLKLGNDDYRHMDAEQARADFLQRVALYEKRYETIKDEEDHGSVRYIKLFNVGQKVVLRHCNGYAPSHIGFYLSNIHITPRRIWLARHAETLHERRGNLGSVSGRLTRQGKEYSRAVSAHVNHARHDVEGEGQRVIIFVGTAAVHQATVEALSSERSDTPKSEDFVAAAEAARGYPVMSTSLLNELDGGDCNGMTYEQIKQEFPEVWEERERDKLNFRYPGAGGESYVDVINRLRPVIVEMERHHSSILVISHLAVQRCIYAYFTGCSMEDLPYVDMDMHTLYELHPGPYGTKVEAVPLGNTDSSKRAGDLE